MPETTVEVVEVTRGQELQALVDSAYAKCLPIDEGDVATYIPELSYANPDDFGICLVTADGRVFEAGTCDKAFTIQSISKPFTFGLALEELGHDKVFQHVGVEPSGDAFNSIQLQSDTNRPFNPMINSGAITVTALLHAIYGSRTHRLFARPVQRPGGADSLRGRRRVSIRTAHRSPQSRNRASAAELRHRARGSRSGAGHLFQAVRDSGDQSRSGDDGRDTLEHGIPPDHRPVGSPYATSKTSCRSCSPAACTTTPVTGPIASASRPRAVWAGASLRW